MARFLLCCLCLIMVINANSVSATANSEEKTGIAEAPTARKLGKHTFHAPSPAEAPKSEGANGEFSREVSSKSGEEKSGNHVEGAEEEEVMKIDHHRRHHHGVDKSVAGGGVILGGLATTFLVAVFCYIRATGRKGSEPGSPTNSDSSVRRMNEGGPGPVQLVHQISG